MSSRVEDEHGAILGTRSAVQVDPKPTTYAWFCLLVIVLISIGNQWQRYTLAYAYGYKGSGVEAGDPKFEITSAYPDLASWYGLLSGLAFTASYATFGIFGGVLSDKVNRKVMIGCVCILWSTCTLLSGLIDSFALLFVLRFMLGIFESAFNPCAYGIIADYFHPSSRTTANSIFNLGIYLGGALSSIATLLITAIGWRKTYGLIGLIGMASGIIGLAFIIEPKRGKFDVKKPEQKIVTQGPSTWQKFKSASAEIFTN